MNLIAFLISICMLCVMIYDRSGVGVIVMTAISILCFNEIKEDDI